MESEWPKISLDALIYDWKRIYEVSCFDKTTKAQIGRKSQQISA